MNGPRQYRAHYAIQDLPELATLKDVIEKRYDDLLFEYLCDQIRLNPKKIGRRTRAGTVPDIALLRDFEVVRVDILGRDGDAFFLDVIVATDIEIAETRHPGPDSDMVSQWFRVRCDLTMAYEEQGFAMHSIAIYRAAKKPSTLSPYLIPYIGKNDLDAVAEDFLARYYPEALESPCPVPARKVAERMGLQVKIMPLSENLSLFGQVLFADGTLQISDDMAGTTMEIQVSAGTILLDQAAYHRLRPASINSTILHECVHWDKDRSFFYLQRQFDEEVSAYAFWKPKLTPSAGKWTPLDRMEWQTKNLTPRILMPAAQARRKTDEILAKCNGRMVSVISEMAEFFQVTWQMAKQRLVELGYEEAGEVIPIASRKATKWLFTPSQENSQRTYEISTQAALREYINNPDFRAEIDTGHFQYVEGRFCVSHERYICPSESGGVRLTEYAKTHLDECCLAFRMPIWSNNDTEALKRNTLYRSAGFGATYEGSGMSVAQTAEELGACATKITGILKKLPAGFGETLNAHMQRLGISGEQLAEKTLVSPKIIQRMINDEKYSGKLKTIVAMCLVLKLEPKLSFDLISKAGFCFRLTEEHMLLELMIESCFNMTLYECNEILQTNGYKTLTSEE